MSKRAVEAIEPADEANKSLRLGPGEQAVRKPLSPRAGTENLPKYVALLSSPPPTIRPPLPARSALPAGPGK